MTITKLEPDHGDINDVIILNGSGFETTPANNKVSFNGVQAQVLSASATRIEVKVPANTRSGKVTVVNVLGTTSSVDNFTINPQADFGNTLSQTVPGQVRLNLYSTARYTEKVKWLVGDLPPMEPVKSADTTVWLYKSQKVKVKLIAYAGKYSDTVEREVTVATDNSLVAYYPMISNGPSFEAINGANASFGNVAVVADKNGNVGGAAEFNGVNSYSTLPTSLIKNLGAAMSFSVWFQCTDPAKAGGILGYQNQTRGGAPSSFVPAVYIGTNKKLFAKYWFGMGPMESVENMNTNWHHLVLTGDAQSQVIYIDGLRQATKVEPVDNGTDMIHNQLGVAYGNNLWPFCPSEWFYFKGKLDEVKFFKKMLSVDEVTALYNHKW